MTVSQGSTYKKDRNFILTFYTNQAYILNGIHELNDGGYTSMLSLIPKFLEEGETEDDLEGSGEFMDGERINMAKKLLFCS